MLTIRPTAEVKALLGLGAEPERRLATSMSEVLVLVLDCAKPIATRSPHPVPGARATASRGSAQNH